MLAEFRGERAEGSQRDQRDASRVARVDERNAKRLREELINSGYSPE